MSPWVEKKSRASVSWYDWLLAVVVLCAFVLWRWLR